LLPWIALAAMPLPASSFTTRSRHAWCG
jgi:hypothetical protein